jgi:DNA-binding NtrC family response regulator
MTHNKNILYVDDEIINNELFSICLKAKYNVFTSESPSEALKIMKEKPIDLLLTDFRMPEMNGIELIKEIKKDFPDKKCIIISGYVDSEIITPADAHLVFKVIMKPWKKDKLVDIINAALV